MKKLLCGEQIREENGLRMFWPLETRSFAKVEVNIRVHAIAIGVKKKFSMGAIEGPVRPQAVIITR